MLTCGSSSRWCLFFSRSQNLWQWKLKQRIQTVCSANEFRRISTKQAGSNFDRRHTVSRQTEMWCHATGSHVEKNPLLLRMSGFSTGSGYTRIFLRTLFSFRLEENTAYRKTQVVKCQPSGWEGCFITSSLHYLLDNEVFYEKGWKIPD